MLNSRKKLIIAWGCNQFGKTSVTVAYASMFLTCRHPVLRTPKDAVVWISVTDNSKIEQVILPKFKDFLPEGSYDYNQNRAVLEIVRGPGKGNKAYFKSAEAGVMSYEGSVIDLLLIDEEHPKDIFLAAKVRTRRKKAPIIISATLWQGLTWLHEDLIKPHLNLPNKTINVENLNGETKDATIVHASMYDNPIFEKEYVDDLYKKESAIDPLMADIRILGLPVSLAGQSEFHRQALMKYRMLAKPPIVGKLVEMR